MFNFLSKNKNNSKEEKKEEEKKISIKDKDYLPGIKGIVNTPLPKYIWLIPLLFFGLIACLLLWMYFSQIDIVASAQATILPNSRIKSIQTKTIGVVSKVFVEDGTEVTKEQKLISFYGKDLKIQLKSLYKKIRGLRLKEIRLLTLQNSYRNKDNSEVIFLKKLAENRYFLKDEDVEQQRILFNMALNSYFISQDLAKSELTNEMLKLSNSIIDKEKILRDLNEKEKTLLVDKSLFDKDVISEEAYNETLSLHNEIEAALKKIDGEVVLLSSNVEIAKKNVSQQENRSLSEIVLELVAVQKELNETRKAIEVEEDLLEEKTILSPIDGTVDNLTIFTIGGVVQPAEVIMNIVPKNSPLEAEAKVLNKDIGFLFLEQEVDVKIDSFNFTKYGKITGKVTKIAKNSVLDPAMGIIFKVIIELNQSYMMVDGKRANLRPGMTAIVDMKVGKRNIGEYIFSPLLRYKDEAMREK